MRQQRLGRQPGLHDMFGRRRLNDRLGFLVEVFRADRHDQAKARPNDVEPHALILADPDPVLVFEAGRDCRLDDFLDPFQVRGKARLLRRSGRLVDGLVAARLVAAFGGKPGFERRKRGLHLFEREVELRRLVGAQLLRTLAEAAALKRPQDRCQPRDLGLGRRIRFLKIGDLRLQRQRFGTVGLDVVRKLGEPFSHAAENSRTVVGLLAASLGFAGFSTIIRR